MANQRTFSPAEAAMVSGLSVSAVQRAVDKGPLTCSCARGGRRFTKANLRYLAAIGGVDRSLMKLTAKAKKQLWRTIAAKTHSRRTREGGASFGTIKLDDRAIARRVRSNLSKLARARRAVVSDPEILGGEPVIAGTRIPAYKIFDILRQGATEEEILAGYPALKREDLELARIYAKAYPRRGRPPKHPWHKGGAVA